MELQRKAGNAAVARLVGTETTAQATHLSGDLAVQRYQMGGSGHGGIEEEALLAANFTPDEASAVYFGNFLRDISQLPKNPAVFEILQILALGEFGREFTAEQLGGLISSEHMDNPAGGTSPEANHAILDSQGLSQEQRSWVTEQWTADFKDMIQQRADASGLPAYIEVSKERARRKLMSAVYKGRNPDGMLDMGSGLHAVEDYFSHTNFIEVAFSILIQDGSVDPNQPPWSRLVERQSMLGYDAVTAGGVDRRGREGIVSGTYAAGANDMVSKLETLHTEVTTGALRSAFIAGCLRKGLIKGGEVGSAIGGNLGWAAGRLVGAAAGATGGALGGGAHGAVEGFRRGQGFLGTIGETISGGFWGMLEGTAAGGVGGAEAGGRLGESLGGGAGYGLGAVTGATTSAVLTGAAITIADGLFLVADGYAQQLFAVESETLSAQAQARQAGIGISHSELAKDAPDHPMFGSSSALARYAATAVGIAMQTAWADVATAGQDPEARQRVADRAAGIVDVLIVHPRESSWWRPIVLTEAAEAAGRG